MYLIIDDHPWSENLSGLRYPYAFDRGDLCSDLTQRYLHAVDPRRHRLVCCCNRQLSPRLVLRKLQTHYCLARLPGSAEHAPTCHHAAGDVGQNRGFEPGALTRSGERLVLDLLLWLPSLDESESSGMPGTWSGTPADHALRLRALLWLLLESSGLNAYHAGVRPRTPLPALFNEAQRICLKTGPQINGNLTDMLLLGGGYEARRAEANRAKLEAAVGRRRRLLVLTMLPNQALAESERSGRRRLQLKSQLGAPVNIPETLLDKALTCAHVRKWRQENRPVLMLGLVTAKAFHKDGRWITYGTVRHLALVPLHQCGAPVPASEHLGLLDRAVSDGDLYVVSALDDPLIEQLKHRSWMTRGDCSMASTRRLHRPTPR